MIKYSVRFIMNILTHEERKKFRKKCSIKIVYFIIKQTTPQQAV